MTSSIGFNVEPDGCFYKNIERGKPVTGTYSRVGMLQEMHEDYCARPPREYWQNERARQWKFQKRSSAGQPMRRRERKLRKMAARNPVKAVLDNMVFMPIHYLERSLSSPRAVLNTAALLALLVAGTWFFNTVPNTKNTHIVAAKNFIQKSPISKKGVAIKNQLSSTIKRLL